jgi:hypothetical protein
VVLTGRVMLRFFGLSVTERKPTCKSLPISKRSDREEMVNKRGQGSRRCSRLSVSCDPRGIFLYRRGEVSSGWIDLKHTADCQKCTSGIESPHYGS